MINDIIKADCELIGKSNHLDWYHLKDISIFLTGGTGFFGKWFIHSFMYLNRIFNLNASITILSRSPEKFISQHPVFAKSRNVNFITGDLRNFCFIDRHFDFFIHAGAPVDTRSSTNDDTEIYTSIIDGTNRILEYAKYTEAKKLLFTSSGAVYGVQPPKLAGFSENSPTLPITPYGKGKLKAESLCIKSDINVSIARCFAFVGPYLPLDAQYAIGNFIRDALLNKKITIKGDGRPYRSYLYTADLMIWLWTILLKGENNNIYNVGSEEALSIAELAEAVSNCTINHAAYEILSTPDNSIPARRYIPSTQKAQTELGLKQTVSLTDSIKRTIDWNLQRCKHSFYQ